MEKLSPSQKIYLSASKMPKAGRGVFAATAINTGEVIETCPVIVLSGKDVLPIKGTLLKNYYFIWHEPRKIATKVALCLGFGSIYNHSYAPNATYKKDLKNERIEFVALRDVKKGEEITVNYNYGNADDKSTLWIKSIKPA